MSSQTSQNPSNGDPYGHVYEPYYRYLSLGVQPYPYASASEWSNDPPMQTNPQIFYIPPSASDNSTVPYQRSHEPSSNTHHQNYGSTGYLPASLDAVIPQEWAGASSHAEVNTRITEQYYIELYRQAMMASLTQGPDAETVVPSQGIPEQYGRSIPSCHVNSFPLYYPHSTRPSGRVLNQIVEHSGVNRHRNPVDSRPSEQMLRPSQRPACAGSSSSLVVACPRPYPATFQARPTTAPHVTPENRFRPYGIAQVDSSKSTRSGHHTAGERGKQKERLSTGLTVVDDNPEVKMKKSVGRARGQRKRKTDAPAQSASVAAVHDGEMTRTEVEAVSEIAPDQAGGAEPTVDTLQQDAALAAELKQKMDAHHHDTRSMGPVRTGRTKPSKLAGWPYVRPPGKSGGASWLWLDNPNERLPDEAAPAVPVVGEEPNLDPSGNSENGVVQGSVSASEHQRQAVQDERRTSEGISNRVGTGLVFETHVEEVSQSAQCSAPITTDNNPRTAPTSQKRKRDAVQEVVCSSKRPKVKTRPETGSNSTVDNGNGTAGLSETSGPASIPGTAIVAATDDVHVPVSSSQLEVGQSFPSSHSLPTNDQAVFPSPDSHPPHVVHAHEWGLAPAYAFDNYQPFQSRTEMTFELDLPSSVISNNAEEEAWYNEGLWKEFDVFPVPAIDDKGKGGPRDTPETYEMEFAPDPGATKAKEKEKASERVDDRLAVQSPSETYPAVKVSMEELHPLMVVERLLGQEHNLRALDDEERLGERGIDPQLLIGLPIPIHQGQQREQTRAVFFRHGVSKPHPH